MRFSFSKIVVVAVAAALTTAGLAVAQGGHGPGGGPGGEPRGGPGGGPPALLGRDLTYAEIHTRRHGASKVIRIDQGKVKSTTDSSVTITENDGNDVTIDVDADTDVRIPRYSGDGDPTVADLKTGRRVVVTGEQGQAADSVVAPRRPHGRR